VTTIYLIRHAQSAPDRTVEEAQWPLSPLGQEQARRLVAQLDDLAIDSFVASPFRRAIDTLAPTATAAGKAITIEHALRERRLTGAFVADWEQLINASWADLSLAHPGGESGHACQQRVVACLTEIAQRHVSERIAVCSHGNAITLFLNSLDATIGQTEWRRMRNPDIFRVDVLDGGWCWDRTFTRDLSV
jgi:2,3-bisphosphoglycerate-dependent phosphoglycerate mutase